MYEKQYEIPVNETEPFPALLPAQGACAPFEEYLGMRIVRADAESTEMTLNFNVKHAQAKGLMHGGAIASLAHSTAAVAIKKKLPPGSDIEIITFSIRFHAPIRGGSIRACGRVTEDNEKDIWGEALVYNGNGDKVATFSAAYRKDRARKFT